MGGLYSNPYLFQDWCSTYGPFFLLPPTKTQKKSSPTIHTIHLKNLIPPVSTHLNKLNWHLKYFLINFPSVLYVLEEWIQEQEITCTKGTPHILNMDILKAKDKIINFKSTHNKHKKIYFMSEIIIILIKDKYNTCQK